MDIELKDLTYEGKLFSDEVIDEIERVISRQVLDAVFGSKTRDAYLLEFNDMFEGNMPAQGDIKRYDGAADIDDPIIRDSLLTLYSSFTAALQHSPLVYVEADDPNDSDNAFIIEEYLETITESRNLRKSLTDAAFICLRDGVCPVHVCWSADYKVARENAWQDENGNIYPDEVGKDNSNGLKRVRTVREEFANEGITARAIDLADFYLYPANSISIEKALGCGERIWLSEYDLINGVRAYGFDPEIVQKMLDYGASGQETLYNEVKDYRAGTEGDSYAPPTKDGFYECFQWFFRMPSIDESEQSKKETEYYHGEYFQIIICPSAHSILTIRNVQSIPYVDFKFVEIPNRFEGYGVPKLLESLQAEANANIQFSIDSMNFESSPVMLMKRNVGIDPDNWQIYPGAIIPVADPSDFQPLQWARSIRDNMQVQMWIQQRAQAIVASQGFGALPNKVRKNAEVEQMVEVVGTKFEMFLSNFQRGVAKFQQKVLDLCIENEKDQVQLQDDFGKQLTATSEMMRKNYRIIPNVIGSDYSPQSKMQKAEMLMQIVRQSPLYMKMIQGGDMSVEYHLMRNLLQSMGERNYQAYIGKEPEKPSQKQMAINQAMQSMQAAQQAGGGQRGAKQPRKGPMGQQ